MKSVQLAPMLSLWYFVMLLCCQGLSYGVNHGEDNFVVEPYIIISRLEYPLQTVVINRRIIISKSKQYSLFKMPNHALTHIS